MSAKDLRDKLNTLINRKKKNEISTRDYYAGLLEIFSDLVLNLKDELASNIKDEDIKKQSSILLISLRQQIDLLEKRGG